MTAEIIGFPSSSLNATPAERLASKIMKLCAEGDLADAEMLPRALGLVLGVVSVTSELSDSEVRSIFEDAVDEGQRKALDALDTLDRPN
jgi:hypothetical protein